MDNPYSLFNRTNDMQVLAFGRATSCNSSTAYGGSIQLTVCTKQWNWFRLVTQSACHYRWLPSKCGESHDVSPYFVENSWWPAHDTFSCRNTSKHSQRYSQLWGRLSDPSLTQVLPATLSGFSLIRCSKKFLCSLVIFIRRTPPPGLVFSTSLASSRASSNFLFYPWSDSAERYAVFSSCDLPAFPLWEQLDHSLFRCLVVFVIPRHDSDVFFFFDTLSRMAMIMDICSKHLHNLGFTGNCAFIPYRTDWSTGNLISWIAHLILRFTISIWHLMHLF